MAKSKGSWLRLGTAAYSLGLDASAVIGLRAVKIGRGGARARTEIRRMIGEKIAAGMALQSLALTGRLGTTGPAILRKTLAHYHRKVRANRRRLTKR